MNAPKTINGYEVVDARPRSSSGLVVLIHKVGDCMPWVTAVWSENTGTEWVWGHYFREESKARRDFETR